MMQDPEWHPNLARMGPAGDEWHAVRKKVQIGKCYPSPLRRLAYLIPARTDRPHVDLFLTRAILFLTHFNILFGNFQQGLHHLELIRQEILERDADCLASRRIQTLIGEL